MDIKVERIEKDINSLRIMYWEDELNTLEIQLKTVFVEVKEYILHKEYPYYNTTNTEHRDRIIIAFSNLLCDIGDSNVKGNLESEIEILRFISYLKIFSKKNPDVKVSDFDFRLIQKDLSYA